MAKKTLRKHFWTDAEIATRGGRVGYQYASDGAVIDAVLVPQRLRCKIGYVQVSMDMTIRKLAAYTTRDYACDLGGVAALDFEWQDTRNRVPNNILKMRRARRN